MTESEAGRRLTVLALSVGHRTAINTEDCEALNMGFEALEKQIPKKPIEVHANKNFPYVYYKCPTCSIDEYATRLHKPCGVYQRYMYRCHSCGQLLDWSDYENDGK